MDEFRRCIEDLGFRGLKLYPKLGFRPDDPLLMEKVYSLCVEHDLPVITHCSRGGVYRKGWSQEQCDRVTAPDAYIPVMKAFPGLRICLAHFGGDADWHTYINIGFDPDDPKARERNWVWRVMAMLRSGEWPGLWTDISYRLDDGLEACATIAWMPASALAASPRPYVRLLGLNSARWPCPLSEDRLLSDHIVPTRELDPLPIDAADRRDFATIRATTARQLVLSRARRDADGRLLGRSTLLQGMPDETYLRRIRTPAHAFSETDRLMARPDEFRGLPQAVSAEACWRDWHRTELTAHDGLVRAEHPMIQSILARNQSASSLKMLLRNPLGFVWRYGLRLRAPESGVDPLVLDPLAMGDLVHMTLERALRALEGDGGFAGASHGQIEAAIETATAEVAAEWEAERAVPPRIIWQRTLAEVRALGVTALTFDAPMPGGRAYGEVPFGGSEPKADAPLPWNPNAPVEIPDTGFRIAGYIDRLDLSEDGSHALVRDYKTGRTAKAGVILDGGSELQRCLYAFAVKALLGNEVAIDASLLFLREGVDRRLDDPEAALEQLAGYLKEARALMLESGGVPGVSTGDKYDELAFALPANAAAVYCRRKIAAAQEHLEPAAEIWEIA